MKHLHQAILVVSNPHNFPTTPCYTTTNETSLLKSTLIGWAEDITDDLAEVAILAGGWSAVIGYIVKIGDDFGVSYFQKTLANKAGVTLNHLSLIWALATLKEVSVRTDLTIQQSYTLKKGLNHVRSHKSYLSRTILSSFKRDHDLANQTSSHMSGWFEINRANYAASISLLEDRDDLYL